MQLVVAMILASAPVQEASTVPVLPDVAVPRSAQVALTLSQLPTPPKTPPPPPGGTRKPGGTRDPLGLCPETVKPLVAIVPPNARGTTTASAPTVWFHVPYGASDIRRLEFAVNDRDERNLYRTTLKPSGMPGLLRASIPSTLSLAPNTNYRWYLEITCQANATTKPDITLNGWLQRLTSANQAQDNANPSYDAVDQIASRYQAASQDPALKQEWQTLLKQLGLELLL
jgi:Domain of Unknown Function (DUF928)